MIKDPPKSKIVQLLGNGILFPDGSRPAEIKYCGEQEILFARHTNNRWYAAHFRWADADKEVIKIDWALFDLPPERNHNE